MRARPAFGRALAVRRAAWSLVALVGCSGSGAGDGADAGSSEDDGGPIDLPTPDFVEPADGEVLLESSRRNDLVLEVRADVGVTRLLLDGRSRGTLTTASRLGELQPESIALRLRGAMVAGIHTLQLHTPDAVESESSDVVTVTIQAPPDAALSYEVGEPVGVGDALVVGRGVAGAVLGVVVADDEGTRMSAWPASATSWDRSRSVELALTGYAAEAREARVAVTTIDDGVRAAWVVGVPGTAIAATQLPWASEEEPLVEVGLGLGDWLQGREWTAIERPLLVGPHVFAEVAAPVDTEAPRPGDRVLAWAPFADLAERVPQIVPVGAVDLDHARGALDTLGVGTDAIAVRRSGFEPVLLEVDPTSGSVGLADTLADASSVRWRDVAGPLVTTRGAFDSRIVAGIEADGAALVVARIDDGSDAPISLSRVALPEGEPASADIAVTVVGGRVVVLVPRGDDRLVAFEASASDAVAIELDASCDAVAPVPDDPTPGEVPAPADAAIDVACLADRVLTLDRLSLTPG